MHVHHSNNANHTGDQLIASDQRPLWGDQFGPATVKFWAACCRMPSPNRPLDRPRSGWPSVGNQQTARTAALAESTAPTHLNVFTVEEYGSNGKTGKKWTNFGAAFPHKEGLGFSIELKAFPIDGRLVVLPPDGDDNHK
jgi:hypothetical protein